EDVAHRLHWVLAVRMGGDDDMIGCARKHLGDAEDHLARKAHDLLVNAQDQCDYIGLPGSQSHTGAVRLIAKLPRHHTHPLLGVGPDVSRVLERARDGGYAEPRHESDRLEGWSLPAFLRESYSVPRFALIHAVPAASLSRHYSCPSGGC